MSRTTLTLAIYIYLSKIIHKLIPNNSIKLKAEYLFWWWTRWKEKELGNTHFKEFFTVYFGIEESFYAGKKMLDIGCGPRGSLEWASKSDTFAIDPLVNKYKKLGIAKHKTTYIEASCEAIPFQTETFDVISSFNSLDHVDDLEKSIAEIKRCLKKGGTFLLIADIHDHKTICEPSGFSWDILEKFTPEFNVITHQKLEGENMYKSIREGILFNDQDNTPRYGILMARFEKL